VSKRTVKELNRSLLNNLSDVRNPITHSDAKDRAGQSLAISICPPSGNLILQTELCLFQLDTKSVKNGPTALYIYNIGK
jgi:hypothetical protein